MNFRLKAFLPCLVIPALLLTTIASAQSHKKFKVAGKKYKIISVSGERTFSYHGSSSSGLSSTGSQNWTLQSDSSTNSFNGAEIMLSGPIAHSMSISDGTSITDSCSDQIDASAFGSNLGIYFFKNGKNFEVTASFDIDPNTPGFVESLSSVCTGKPSGITGYLLRVAQTGSGADECDGAEMCTMLSSKQMKKKKITLEFSRIDEAVTSDEVSTITTSLQVVLKKVKSKKRKK